LKDAIEQMTRLLELPEGYRLGIVPASDTGAFEMAMWSMLGPRPVDMLVWESFGAGWATDATKQLKLDDCRVLKADYGLLPCLTDCRREADVCLTQNGTTSGARIPNFDWIADDREGLTFVDATSAVFAQPVDWAKVDVLTFSWQKVLGGEGAGGKLIDGIFTGATINTPSMWAVADLVDALDWVEEIGGLPAMHARADANATALQAWVDGQDWIENLVADPALRSNTSVCLKIADPAVSALDEAGQRGFTKQMVKLLEEQGVAFDINGYRDAPPGLRIWCGATVNAIDIKALGPWLAWAFAQAKLSLS